MVKFFKNMKVEMSDAFKKMDMDDDAFDQVDINNDGKISIDEFLKWSLGE